MFELDKKQSEDFEIWNNKHQCKLKENCGAIGGRLTFSFTPNGLGVITVVKCACGEKIDLSDYENW